MNRTEVQSAINDFRKAFKDDLGTRFVYGKKKTSTGGGFSIDEENIAYWWFSTTSKGQQLYGTLSVATDEALMEAGLNQKSTGIFTCIYEDILDLQEIDPKTNKPFLDKQELLDDYILVFTHGYVRYYRIVDFSFAFELRDTYIFMKFGVVDVEEKEIGDDFAYPYK